MLPWLLYALKKEFGKETKSSEASKVFIRREDTCGESMGGLREREGESRGLLGWVKSLIGRQFWVSNHLALSGFESISGLAQGPTLGARASFSQDGLRR